MSEAPRSRPPAATEDPAIQSIYATLCAAVGHTQADRWLAARTGVPAGPGNQPSSAGSSPSRRQPPSRALTSGSRSSGHLNPIGSITENALASVRGSARAVDLSPSQAEGSPADAAVASLAESAADLLAAGMTEVPRLRVDDDVDDEADIPVDTQRSLNDRALLRAERTTGFATQFLTAKEHRVYVALYAVAMVVGIQHGYARHTTYVTYHATTEQIAHELRLSRTTVYKALKKLGARGLIAQAGHKTTVPRPGPGGTTVDATRASGSLIKVKLRPRGSGTARIAIEEYKHDWRDLAGDIKAGRTVYAYIQAQREDEGEQSLKPQEGKSWDIDSIVDWAVNPGVFKRKKPMDLTVQAIKEQHGYLPLAAMLKVPQMPRSVRHETIDAFSHLIAHVLDDAQSQAFYAWLLWRAVKHADAGENRFPELYRMIDQVYKDRRAGSAQTAGALLIYRLRAHGIMDWLNEAPGAAADMHGEVPSWGNPEVIRPAAVA